MSSGNVLGVTLGVALASNPQLPLRQEFELVGPPLGNEVAPHRNRLLADAQGGRNGSLAPEVGDCIGLTHADSVSMLKRYVNHDSRALPYAVGIMETMGDRIRRVRENRGLDQKAVAAIVGVTPAAISMWESGATTGIRPENFMRFCAYFNVDPWSVVFGPEGDPSPKTPDAPRRFRFEPKRVL